MKVGDILQVGMGLGFGIYCGTLVIIIETSSEWIRVIYINNKTYQTHSIWKIETCQIKRYFKEVDK